MKTKNELKKEAFALSVGTLPDYIDNKGEIIANVIAGASTLAMITPQTGIKAGSTERLNILSTDVVWSNGDCVSAATGATTAIVARDISTVRLTDRELLCLDDLDAKLPMIQSAGARNEDLPFGQLYIEEKVKHNSNQLEKLAWQGDIAGGAGNLALQDGYLVLAAAEVGSQAYNAIYGAGDLGGVANFAADPIAVMDLIVANRTAELYERDDMTVWMSLANYSLLNKALRDTFGLNATADFANTGMENGTQTMMYPGTNIIVKGTHGLSGSDDLFATYLANMRYGTDMENDKEDVQLFFDKYHKELVSDLVFSIGFQYEDASQVLTIVAP